MRTCMGCRKEDSPEALIRLVLGEGGELLVDLAGRAFGRGGWVHARPACLVHAARGGAAKSFKAEVSSDVRALFAAVRAAADHRVEALLGAARGAQKVAAGTDAADGAFGRGEARLCLLAEDARASAQAGFLARAGASGKVSVWGTKERVGRALGRPETAVVAILDEGLAEAIARAIALSSLPEPDARQPGADQVVVEVR